MLFISGISTSGKTELGKALSIQLDSVLIDQKDYFLKDKPKTKLSNEEEVTNYDSIDAIDWDNFNLKLLSLSISKIKTVVICFALIPDLIKVTPDLCIYLNYNIHEDLLIDTISSRRNKNSLAVKELVVPFHKSLHKSLKIDNSINIYDSNLNRIGPVKIMEMIKLM